MEPQVFWALGISVVYSLLCGLGGTPSYWVCAVKAVSVPIQGNRGIAP